MVKSAKNTICEICAHNSLSYEIFDIFAHTVVFSRKTVNSGKDAICDTCAQKIVEIWVLWNFLLLQ